MHHGENLYKCQYYNNINFNRVDMKTHMKNAHLSEISNSIQSNIIINRQTMSVDNSIDRGRSKDNFLEPQALESIDATLVSPTCRVILIESTPLKMNNKSRGISIRNDKLGAISSNGLPFVCPKCDDFKTINIELFREHLYKEVNYKTWKCLKYFEISDSLKKMAWHVKKHGIGSKYVKIEDGEKLKWSYFKLLDISLIVKERLILLLKKKNIEHEKKEVLVSQPSSDPASNDDVIW
ncbi:hypothetical protein AGLY_000417 [Aphis glycines]|uniref:Uncharacterized protein n=1 Tax=Aphis glycines TaxID=307491 RepID=A0A6G0U724_APHGL|nr:hypothetical protein AGLY_000417 [Aphis glycines]